MPDRDPRVDLSGELLPEHALAAVEALDSRTIRIASGPDPAAALTAAALLVLVARTHAHVEIHEDVELPANPWGAPTLAALLEKLAPIRPMPRANPISRVIISTGTHAGADRYLAPATWTVAITSDVHTQSTRLARLAVPAGQPDVGGRTRLACAPYGGMFGAAIAAADLFCESLAPLGLPAAERRSEFIWNLLDYTYTAASEPATTDAAPVWPALLFAGTGSVGSSAAAALACDDLSGLVGGAVDGDDFDADRNPYRYPAALGDESGPKAGWVTDMLTSAGALVEPHVGPVHDWTLNQPEPGFDGVVISSVDTVDGRYEVADILARTTLSAAVRALGFHVQREHLGDGLRCPFCDFVSLESPLAQAAADANLFGLPEQRIIELTYLGGGLAQHDLDQMVQAGKLTAEAAPGLLGGRVADLRRRLYAQAAIPAQNPEVAPPAPLSAPFVSWAVGVLLAAEVAKIARGLKPVNRRVEVDLHGYPADFVHRYPANTSGRCACARATRRRWIRDLYPDHLWPVHTQRHVAADGEPEPDTQADLSAEMEMTLVACDHVRSVGYDAATRTMRVAFHGGEVYDYLEVEAALFEQMLLPHPWRVVGAAVKSHRSRRLAA